MSGNILHVILGFIVIGATSVQISQAVDSQLLTFLLNEMSNFRTSSLAMENEINELKTAIATLTSHNNQLQGLVTSLNSQCRDCEQHLLGNVSKLNSDIQTIARATNTSVLYVVRKHEVFEEHIEKLLANQSKDFKTQIQNFSTHPVIFSVHGSAGDKLQFSGIKFPQVSIDTPPNYNVATGVYTVPEDGYYTLRITDGILRSLKNLSPFMVDGHRQTGCYGLDQTNNAFSVCQIYVYLRAGQRVWTQDSLEFIHTNTTVFSGWKM